jgi:hypothetical protein
MPARIATRDSSGKTVWVNEIEGRRIPTTTLASSSREHIEGMREYRLDNGAPVNRLSDLEFRTMQGETLRRVET